jgi:NitT/TauT family transport system ATP-binding protein
MIKFNNVTKSFGNKKILLNSNIEFEKGKINILNGPSGSGKTTILKIIGGIDSNFTGNIIGRPEKISYLFQEDRLLPYFNVIDNVCFILPDTLSRKEKKEIAAKYLQLMELEYEHNSYPHELSGGMARRVAIARSLAYPSQLLLLDEPFTGLNLDLKYKVANIISDSLKENDKTIILVTHDTQLMDSFNYANILNLV